MLVNEKDELLELSKKTKEFRAPVTLDQQSVGRLSRMDAIQQQNMSLATETNRKQTLMLVNRKQRSEVNKNTKRTFQPNMNVNMLYMRLTCPAQRSWRRAT